MRVEAVDAGADRRGNLVPFAEGGGFGFAERADRGEQIRPMTVLMTQGLRLLRKQIAKCIGMLEQVPQARVGARQECRLRKSR